MSLCWTMLRQWLCTRLATKNTRIQSYGCQQTTDMVGENVTIHMVEVTRHFSPCITIFCASRMITIFNIYPEIKKKLEHFKVIICTSILRTVFPHREFEIVSALNERRVSVNRYSFYLLINLWKFEQSQIDACLVFVNSLSSQIYSHRIFLIKTHRVSFAQNIDPDFLISIW